MDCNISNFDKSNVNLEIVNTINNKRIPHAIALEYDDVSILKNNIDFISMWAVCKLDNPPCLNCVSCVKAFEKNHSDIYYAEKFGKKQIVNVDEIRKICNTAYIKPNEAPRKVYIIEDCDKMQLEAQNAFLKLLEEPPQDILFILTCSKFEALISTIRSRVTLFTLSNGFINFDEDLAFKLALETANALCKNSELDLLISTNKYSDKTIAMQALDYLEDIFRDSLSGGFTAKYTYQEISTNLSKSIKKQSLINMIAEIDNAKQLLQSNANANLFCTWLCSTLKKQKYI